MKNAFFTYAVAVPLLFLASCGSEGTAITDVKTDLHFETYDIKSDSLKDTADEIPSDTDSVIPEDSQEQDKETVISDYAEAEAEIQPGEFGWPCTKNEECDSYLCISTIKGSVCTSICNANSSCPDITWECKYISLPGSDPFYACLPPATSLCRPCSSNDDCSLYTGEINAKCIPFGPQGKFCGIFCTDENPGCPSGYACKSKTDIENKNVKQCVPLADDCPCLFAYFGLETECYLKNKYGTCYGERECTKDGWKECTAKAAEAEICNGKDDDCDGLMDEDLGTTSCGLGQCLHTVQNCKKGVPGVCDPMEGATKEVCENVNPADNDCNGQTDESWPDKGNKCFNGKGECKKEGKMICNQYGDGLECDAKEGTPSTEICNGKDDDCDDKTDEELGTKSCGKGICFHTVDFCKNGTEQVCLEKEGAQTKDDPDVNADAELKYTDTNCDGIDGNIELAVFADGASGNDNFQGTMDKPKKTISAAISAAANTGKVHVYVSAGTYGESVTLQNGISIFGKFSKTENWARSSSNMTIISGGVKAVIAENISVSTQVMGFTISGSAAGGNGQSSYAVFVKNSTGLKLSDDLIQAGNGSAGLNGTGGGNGADTSSKNGQPGKPGCEDSSGLCSSCSKPTGGSAGTGACGINGGKGGDAGHSSGSGQNGTGGGGSGGGAGGSGGPCCMGNSAPLWYQKGANGNNGNNGSSGTGGAIFGSAIADAYVPSDGQNGAKGEEGAGGGGGGGGGGGETWCDSYGSSAGGGGAGGCGGNPGTGGKGGGASVGIFVWGGSVAVSNSTIKTGTGGSGGTGGTGGSGTLGGTGGSGGAYGGSDSQDDGSMGGAGGNGGKGGNGGAGGGGGGGPSIGILCGSNASLSLANNVFQLGSGGSGGSSAGISGQKGMTTNTKDCKIE